MCDRCAQVIAVEEENRAWYARRVQLDYLLFVMFWAMWWLLLHIAMDERPVSRILWMMVGWNALNILEFVRAIFKTRTILKLSAERLAQLRSVSLRCNR